MSGKDILASWQDTVPKTEKRRNVESVINYAFKHWEWTKSSKIKVTDERLLYYKNEVNPQDEKVAIDGSFKIPTVKGRTVKGFYIKKILYMKKIVDLVERYRK